MKKLVSVLLATTMALSLAACGGNTPSATSAQNSPTPAPASTESKTEPPAPVAESDKQVTLEMWHIHTADSRKVPIEEAVSRFEAENNVKINVSVLENDPYKTKLKTAMGSGDEPDVFHSWGGGWLKSFVDAGLVYDMTNEVNGYKDKLSEASVGMNTFDGKVWGSPMFNSSTLLYYNKTIFEKYGLQAPKTYDELLSVCQTLLDNGVYPFALGNKSKWPGAQHFVLLSMRLGGADIFQRAMDGAVTFEDPTFIKAGEMVVDLVDKGYFPEGVNGINYDTGGSRMMFYTGQCAMILQTSGFLSSCKSEAPEFYENDLDFMLYPEVAGGVGKATDILAGENAFSVAANSKNIELSTKIVEYLSTNEEIQQAFADNGSLAALKGITTEDPLVSGAMDQLINATYLQNFIDQTLSPTLSEKHKDTVQALFGKTMTPEEAAKEMQKAFTEE